MIVIIFTAVGVNIDGADILELGQTVGRFHIHQSAVNTIIIVVIVDILVLVVWQTIIVNINNLGRPQLSVNHFIDKINYFVGILAIVELGLSCIYLVDGGCWSSKLNVEGSKVLRNSCNKESSKKKEEQIKSC